MGYKRPVSNRFLTKISTQRRRDAEENAQNTGPVFAGVILARGLIQVRRGRSDRPKSIAHGDGFGGRPASCGVRNGAFWGRRVIHGADGRAFGGDGAG